MTKKRVCIGIAGFCISSHVVSVEAQRLRMHERLDRRDVVDKTTITTPVIITEQRRRLISQQHLRAQIDRTSPMAPPIGEEEATTIGTGGFDFSGIETTIDESIPDDHFFEFEDVTSTSHTVNTRPGDHFQDGDDSSGGVIDDNNQQHETPFSTPENYHAYSWVDYYNFQKQEWIPSKWWDAN